MHARIQDGKGRFIKGVLLAWIPFLLFLVPAVANAFRGISSQKATGLGAVAGGLAEGFVVFGFAAVLISEVAAIVLLVRTLSTEHLGQSVLSVVSIFCSGLMLAILATFIWLAGVQH